MSPIQVIVGDPTYDWWELVPAIVGGIIGALAGGIPAWLLARRGSREALVRDLRQRQDAELAAAFRVFTKLSMIVNDLSSTLLQIREMLKRPHDPSDESSVQRRVSAFAGAQVMPDAAFTADELYVFVAAGEGEYLTELDLLGRRYVTDMRSLITYGELKVDLHDLISNLTDVKFGPGDVVLTRVDDDAANKLRLKARTLESIIVPLISMIESDVVQGVKIAEQFESKLKKHFLGRKVPGFDFDELRKLMPDLVGEPTPAKSKLSEQDTRE